MFFCDNCLRFFKKPISIMHTDAEIYISQKEEACPYCREINFLDAFKCKRCGKLYIKKGRFCPECLTELKGIINGFLNKFSVDEQEAMLDGL